MKLFEKDTEMKGYNIILNEGYKFLDDSQSEYAENQSELNDFLTMVKPIENESVNDSIIVKLLTDKGINFNKFDNSHSYGLTFSIVMGKLWTEHYLVKHLKDKNNPLYNDYTIENAQESLDLTKSTIKELKSFLRLN